MLQKEEFQMNIDSLRPNIEAMTEAIRGTVYSSMDRYVGKGVVKTWTFRGNKDGLVTKQ